MIASIVIVIPLSHSIINVLLHTHMFSINDAMVPTCAPNMKLETTNANAMLITSRRIMFKL